MLSQERLQAKYEYRQGCLYYKTGGRNGRRAGSLSDRGYRIVWQDGKPHKEHRAIWTLLNGPIPDGAEIDHVNGIKDDNRIENLRLASHGQNQANTPKYRNNSSGIKGVSWREDYGVWTAVIQKDGRQRSLGHFKDKQAAAEAYRKAALQLHGEFTNLG